MKMLDCPPTNPPEGGHANISPGEMNISSSTRAPSSIAPNGSSRLGHPKAKAFDGQAAAAKASLRGAGMQNAGKPHKHTSTKTGMQKQPYSPSHVAAPAATAGKAKATAPHRRYAAGENHKPASPYSAYKLIGALAVAAALLLAITFALFAGSAAYSAPAASNENGEISAEPPSNSAHAAVEKDKNAGLPALKASGKNFVVCIDPGHGYDDPGAVCPDTIGDASEKDITLAAGLKLRDILIEAGISVILTRHDDIVPESLGGAGQYTLDPFERVDFVLAHPETDLFISLHCDAYAEDPSVGGTRIYIYEKAAAGTDYYAQTLSVSIGEALGANVPIISKDIYEAYYVTKKLPIPSALIEMGFITNPADAENLLSDAWREKFAMGVAAGIIEFINSTQ